MSACSCRQKSLLCAATAGAHLRDRHAHPMHDFQRIAHAKVTPSSSEINIARVVRAVTPIIRLARSDPDAGQRSPVRWARESPATDGPLPLRR